MAVFLDDLKIDFPVYLAPMAGISDVSFRTLMRRMGCGVTVTELLSSEAMVRYNARTKRMLRIHQDERPTGVQIFGSDANAMADTAKMCEDAGADFIDINLGCPVRKIVKQCAGAALLDEDNLPELAKILTTVKNAIAIPLTIKIRTGFKDRKFTYREVIRIAEDAGIAAVAIHGRTREQAYEGFADWDAIRDAKHHARIPIIGNGDLNTWKTAMIRWQESGCDGIMIGRGCLRNPWIFREIRAASKGLDPTHLDIRRDIGEVLHAHVELLEYYEDERRGLIQLKKFIAWYFTCMHGVAKFRAKLFQMQSFDEILQAAYDFLEAQDDKDFGFKEGERFLMGGHG